MATHHAVPGEIVDLARWACDLPEDKSKAIVKTEAMELARLVLPAGHEIPEHVVDGIVVMHCLEGRVGFTTMGRTRELHAGQLLYLKPGEPYALRGMEEAVVVLTVVFDGHGHA